MNIKLELHVDAVNYILSALGQRPLAEALDTFMKVKGQADAQVVQQQSQNEQKPE